LRTRHEADLLQRRFIMNVGLQPCIVETSFQTPCFRGIIKRGNCHHKLVVSAQPHVF
jgi:hypothetical protein